MSTAAHILIDFADEDLMREYQMGNEAAFGLLYQRHSSRIYGYISSKLGDPASADDVFQLTFLKLHNSKEKYDADLPFLPWIFTVCRNVILDHFRMISRSNEFIFNDSQDNLLVKNNPVFSTNTQHVSFNDILNNSTLDKNEKELISLRYGDELPFDEIAKKLNTTSVNARQLVSRAVRKLKHIISTSTSGDKE